jgi:hypothetical protein
MYLTEEMMTIKMTNMISVSQMRMKKVQKLTKMNHLLKLQKVTRMNHLLKLIHMEVVEKVHLHLVHLDQEL